MGDFALPLLLSAALLASTLRLGFAQYDLVHENDRGAPAAITNVPFPDGRPQGAYSHTRWEKNTKHHAKENIEWIIQDFVSVYSFAFL
jgi:hypothetical protein